MATTVMATLTGKVIIMNFSIGYGSDKNIY